MLPTYLEDVPLLGPRKLKSSPPIGRCVPQIVLEGDSNYLLPLPSTTLHCKCLEQKLPDCSYTIYQTFHSLGGQPTFARSVPQCPMLCSNSYYSSRLAGKESYIKQVNYLIELYSHFHPPVHPAYRLPALRQRRFLNPIFHHASLSNRFHTHRYPFFQKISLVVIHTRYRSARYLRSTRLQPAVLSCGMFRPQITTEY